MPSSIQYREWDRQPDTPVRVHSSLLPYRPLAGFVGKNAIEGLRRNMTLTNSVYGAEQSGHAITHLATTNLTTILDANNIIGDSAVSIFLHYQKRDTTNRVSGAFGAANVTTTTRCGAHVPFNDGTVYWDFGGTTGSNRVSVGGLSFGNDCWAFLAGPRGMEIWQNGNLRASNSTASSRTGSATGAWVLGTHAQTTATSDLANYYSVVVFYEQVPQGLARDITRSISSFYGGLFEPEPIHIYWPSAVGSSTVPVLYRQRQMQGMAA